MGGNVRRLWLGVLTLVLACASGVVPALAQIPGELPNDVSLSVTVGEPNRTLAVTATGAASFPGTRLYVSWDFQRSPCPLLLDDLPNEGGWALPDPLTGAVYRPVGPGPFSESGTITVPPGFTRFCAYLTDDSEDFYVVRRRALRVPVDPDADLTRPAVIDVLLNSPRVHRDVKAWIREGEERDELGLGLNGPGYMRLTDLTGDGYAEAIAQPSAGGAGRVHAYYIVTTHRGVPEVAVAARKAFNGTIQKRGRGFREIIPRYAPRDALCCASTRSVRVIRWNGVRFVERSRRIVRTRFWKPAVAPTPLRAPAPAPTAPTPTPAPQPSAPRCDPNYTGACIPVVPYDLDCGDVSAVNFGSVGSDPHRFDGDGDGIACES